MTSLSCRKCQMLPRNNYVWCRTGSFRAVLGKARCFWQSSGFFPWITWVLFLNIVVNDRVVSKSEAINMIIQCPNCGFSGKVPKRAFDIPHQARCKRCHHLFDLSRLVDVVPSMASPSWISGIDPAQANHAIADASSSSSYELKAITDDFGLMKAAEGLDDEWPDHEQDPYRRAAAKLIEASRQRSRRRLCPPALRRLRRPISDPWRSGQRLTPGTPECWRRGECFC